MWSKKMADSVMKRTPLLSKTPVNRDKWSYDFGVVLKGFEAVFLATNDKLYFDYIYDNLSPFIGADGSIAGYSLEFFNIDYVNNGKVLLTLYEHTKEERFKIAADTLRHQLRLHPQTSDNVFWHKLIYPHQVWLDGLYMGAPFYAEYVKNYGDVADFDHIANQFIYCAKRAKDEKTGLLYHAYDEAKKQPWAHKDTGLSRNFWGRSMGWFVMGLVDTISFLPKDHADYETLVTIFRKTLIALKNVQDDTGVWYQVLDSGHKKGNYLEASGSCMNLYAIAKGLDLGIIDDSWKAVAKKAYDGIIAEFVLLTDEGLVNLNKTCQVAGLGGDDNRDGSYAYYISENIITNDQKGIGAFILATSIYEKISNQ